ncbi:hypothetical protein KY349_04970 [Candidatus Woesearchaeota archaeon]|jgi:hypothetical protein|nr:hypothetical protein [Candidatus Woesearchaeota archaeon]
MKRTIIPGIMALLIILLAFGCQQPASDDVAPDTEPDVEINPITGEPYQDIVEKRGVQTNITEFNELLLRATRITSYKYSLVDTGLGVEGYDFTVLGRFVKVRLPDVQEHDSGVVFDEVFMERLTKQAFSHCSRYVCEKPDIDKEIERVEYSDYYISDPMEYLYKVTDAEYVKDDVLGDQYTRVYSAKFEGKDARVWLQEYYGFPLKIVIRNEDDSKRTIEFEDMMIDAARRGEIELPFNFTISGEEGSWYFWEHYLGEWPPEGSGIRPLGDVEPKLSV